MCIQHWSHLSVSIISKKNLKHLNMNGLLLASKCTKSSLPPSTWVLAKDGICNKSGRPDWLSTSCQTQNFPPVHTWYPGQITLLLRDGKDTLYGQNWTRPSLIWMVLGQSYKTHSHSICPAIHLSPWSNWKISFDTMQMLWNWIEYRAHSHKWYCLLSP